MYKVIIHKKVMEKYRYEYKIRNNKINIRNSEINPKVIILVCKQFNTDS